MSVQPKLENPKIYFVRVTRKFGTQGITVAKYDPDSTFSPPLTPSSAVSRDECLSSLFPCVVSKYMKVLFPRVKDHSSGWTSMTGPSYYSVWSGLIFVFLVFLPLIKVVQIWVNIGAGPHSRYGTTDTGYLGSVRFVLKPKNRIDDLFEWTTLSFS